ncbi:MAG: hypothetical protein ABI619_13575, partial [Betaproteobacteria bacterium]
ATESPEITLNVNDDTIVELDELIYFEALATSTSCYVVVSDGNSAAVEIKDNEWRWVTRSSRLTVKPGSSPVEINDGDAPKDLWDFKLEYVYEASPWNSVINVTMDTSSSYTQKDRPNDLSLQITQYNASMHGTYQFVLDSQTGLIVGQKTVTGQNNGIAVTYLDADHDGDYSLPTQHTVKLAIKGSAGHNGTYETTTSTTGTQLGGQFVKVVNYGEETFSNHTTEFVAKKGN